MYRNIPRWSSPMFGALPLTATPSMRSRTVMAVITCVANVLAHAPGLVRYGSKPVRDLARDPALADTIARHGRSFDDALAYAPNQAYVGGLEPDDLRARARPWFGTRVPGAARIGPFGDILDEMELLALLKRCDRARLVQLDGDT